MKKKHIHKSKDKEGTHFYVNYSHEIPSPPPMAPMPPMPPMPHFGSTFVGHARSTSTINRTFQEVDDEILQLMIVLPGIDKSTLKVRSKATKVRISAKLQEDYVDKIAPEELVMMINLIEEVNPEEANASYSDGVLTIHIPVAETSHDAEIEYDE